MVTIAFVVNVVRRRAKDKLLIVGFFFPRPLPYALRVQLVLGKPRDQQESVAEGTLQPTIGPADELHRPSGERSVHAEHAKSRHAVHENRKGNPFRGGKGGYPIRSKSPFFFPLSRSPTTCTAIRTVTRTAWTWSAWTYNAAATTGSLATRSSGGIAA